MLQATHWVVPLRYMDIFLDHHMVQTLQQRKIVISVWAVFLFLDWWFRSRPCLLPFSLINIKSWLFKFSFLRLLCKSLGIFFSSELASFSWKLLLVGFAFQCQGSVSKLVNASTIWPAWQWRWRMFDKVWQNHPNQKLRLIIVVSKNLEDGFDLKLNFTRNFRVRWFPKPNASKYWHHFSLPIFL